MKETILPTTTNVHENSELKYETIDSLDLIKSERFTEHCCKSIEFNVGCPNCRLSYIRNMKYYLRNKLVDLKLQMFDYKANFKKPCFNCSSSFHGSSYNDGHFNLQKFVRDGDEECRSCQRKFTTDRSFQHNCNICNASFNNCELLVHHRNSKHNSKKPYQCAACHQSLSYGSVNNHVKKHTLPHICPHCSKRYAIKMHLKLHMLSHTGENLFLCKYCPKQYTTKQYFDNHLFEHLGGKKFKCDLCDNKTFAKRYLLLRHNRLIHTEKATHLKKLFSCKYCHKQCKAKQTLEFHLFSHTGGQKFKCDTCDKTFAKPYLLNRHKLIHMEKSFQCKYCSKKYRTKQNLDIHLFEHLDGKKFKCDLCNKNFATQEKLNAHKSCHMDKSFQCKYCSKQYARKFALDVHLYEHTGFKQFKCDLCDKTFAKQCKLNQHKFVHMKKSFQCTICLRFYKTPEYLRAHIRRVHILLGENISEVITTESRKTISKSN